MAILEDENRALRKRVRALEAELRHLQQAHMQIVTENAHLKERVNALLVRLQPDSYLEERKFPRLATTLRVDSMNRRGDVAMGIARNISLGGAFLETELDLTPGEFLTLVFELEAQPFKLQAEVVRTSHEGYGVKFALERHQREALEVRITRLENKF